MPLATVFTLPRTYMAEFPDKCICCHKAPDTTIKVINNSQNPFLSFFLPIYYFFGWSSVRVPICHGCKWRFRFQRYGREIILWTLMLIGIFVLMPYFSGWNSLLRKIVVGGIIIGAMIPYVLFEIYWPRIFDTTANSKTIDYEFADKDYANEFFILNIEHIDLYKL